MLPASEVRFAEKFVGWIDANVPALPEDSPIRTIAEECGHAVARRAGLPGIGSRPLASLADATTELVARMEEAGARPMERLTVEQWRIVGAGVPVTLDELRDASDTCVRLWVPDATSDGAYAASALHAAGVLKGALVQSWRR